jgi:hypothetical protein
MLLRESILRGLLLPWAKARPRTSQMALRA